jgi:hypothetical protein
MEKFGKLTVYIILFFPPFRNLNVLSKQLFCRALSKCPSQKKIAENWKIHDYCAMLFFLAVTVAVRIA